MPGVFVPHGAPFWLLPLMALIADRLLLRAVAAYAAGGYAALEAAPRTAASSRLLAQLK